MAGGYVYFMTNRRDGPPTAGVTGGLIRLCYEHRDRPIDGFTKQYGLKALVYFGTYDDI
jgi:putative endonuclease